MSSESDNSEAVSAASRRRVTAAQLEILWEFLNSNRDVALGHNKAAQARAYARRKWQVVANSLNAQGEGAVKDWKGWSKYWVDYKAKLKRRLANVRSSHNQTGGGPSSVTPLSEQEKKFLQITGADFGQGMPGIRVEISDTISQTNIFASQEQSTGSSRQPPAAVPTNNFEVVYATEAMVVELAPTTFDVQQPTAVAGDAELPAAAAEDVELPAAVAGDVELPAAVPGDVEQPSLAAGPVRRRRLRRHRIDPLTQEAARQAVVDSSRVRAQAAANSVAMLERIANTLENLVTILARIEARLPAAATDV